MEEESFLFQPEQPKKKVEIPLEEKLGMSLDEIAKKKRGDREEGLTYREKYETPMPPKGSKHMRLRLNLSSTEIEKILKAHNYDAKGRTLKAYVILDKEESPFSFTK